MNFTMVKFAKIDCSSYLDDWQQQVIQKALKIGNEVQGSSSSERHQLSGSFNCVATSTPTQRKSCAEGNDVNKSMVTDVLIQKSIDDVVSNNLSVSKVLAVVENKRKEEVQETTEKQVATYLAKQEQLLKQTAALLDQQQAQSRAKALKAQEAQLLQQKEEEASAAELKLRQEQQQQKRAQRVSVRDEQIKAAEHKKKEADAERKKKVTLSRKYVEEIFHYHAQFIEACKNINHEMLLCGDTQMLSPIAAQVKLLQTNMQSLIQQVKDRDINQDDVDAAKIIYDKTNLLHLGVQELVAKINKQVEEKETIKQPSPPEPQSQTESIGNAKQFENNSSVNVKSMKNSDSVSELSDCVGKESLQRYLELKELKQNNERLFEHLVKDDRLKRFRFDCQKAVNIPVNAISPVSASHLRDKLQKLSFLLSGRPVTIGDGIRVSASEHPAGIPFCKDLLAKKFVKQGASTVSSKPEAAFAIAAVMVALWQEFPDWGLLLLAHFHQECPYLIPAFWPQLEGQSNKDYYLSLGYTYNEEGEVEKQDKFLKRMSGIMRLYSALLISRLPRDRQNRPHPHDLGNGWLWLTSLLNLEPRPDICASLLHDFLEVTGSSLFHQYGRQFQKLLLLICKEYFPRLQKIAVSSSGPVVRLETFLQAILKQGSRPPPGMLPSNFW